MIKIVLIVGIIVLQTYFGYIRSRILGAILPIASILIFIYLLYKGILEFNLITVILPLVGLFSLTGLWQSGKNKKDIKEKNEIDKMKAKDRQ